MKRRLAAILAADVVGYSKLMAADESGTLNALSNLIENSIQPLITDHSGRVVKLMGDGILAEFGSVVDAVSCAISWQKHIGNGDNHLQFRIGINLGDIIHQDGDIFGDGVNIAARLESLAEPGGICISSIVLESLGNRLEDNFGDGGRHEVKNISEPLQVYRWPHSDGQPASTQIGSSEKPTIAVLAFTNMSGDSEQEYFSDGISEDIITQLSRFRTVNVIARNSSFTFKGEKTDAKQIGKKLGAHYIVEGSVRTSGNRARITAQLVDTETGNHLWAERYDRELQDIFAVQDEVTQSIVAVLPGRVQEDVAEQASRKPTGSMKAHELMLRAKSLRDSLSAEDNLKARQLLERALKLDPRHARVHMYLADTYVVDMMLGLATGSESSESWRLSKIGVKLDANDVYIQDQLGFAYLCEGMWEDAEIQFEKTLSQIVNEAESMAWCGYGFMLLGKHERAYQVVQKAMQLDPLHAPSLQWIFGQICFCLQRYDDAVRTLVGNALLNSVAHAFLAAAQAQAHHQSEAATALASFINHRRQELNSRGIDVVENSLTTLAADYRKLWRHESDWEHLADGLRRAGLPD
ncbi:MAG: adenylate/guanylate cyclase domain-containing protein [Rhizobiaceae bacterium]|nr:adenylate/guanylate cyclase domain-containing protein [Rhizobiaceae bacterium]